MHPMFYWPLADWGGAMQHAAGDPAVCDVARCGGVWWYSMAGAGPGFFSTHQTGHCQWAADPHGPDQTQVRPLHSKWPSLTGLLASSQMIFSSSLMERMLESAVSDNREASAATLPQHTENAVRLLHMVQDFLQAEGLVSPALWTEKVLEETVTLMDSLMVWYSAGTQWFQLSQVGLRLLLGFMAQEDTQVNWFSLFFVISFTKRSAIVMKLHCKYMWLSKGVIKKLKP